MDWDALATRYDAQLWLERRPLQAALELARPGCNDRLLDVGTGTGAVLESLAGQPERPRQATGVDSSAAMLSHIGSLPAGWEVLVADVGALPLESASFDVAIASYVLHVLNAPARMPALRELHRVLRPAGVLVTVTPALPLPADHPFHRWIVRRLEADSGPRRAMLPLDPRRLLAAAGFEVEETRRVWLGYHSLCVRARRS